MPQTQQTQTPIRPRPKTATKGKGQLIQDLARNSTLTVTEIARISETSKSNVSHILKRYNLQEEHINNYKSQRADIIAGIGEKILSRINLPAIKVKTPKDVRDMLTGFGILYDKERLQNDLSTNNVTSITADIASLRGMGKVEGKGDRTLDTPCKTDPTTSHNSRK